MSAKFDGAFAEDLAERAVSTAGYGVITMLTADASGAISGNPQQWWLIVGLPTVLCVIKAVLANIAIPSGGSGTASLVGVKSDSKAA